MQIIAKKRDWIPYLLDETGVNDLDMVLSSRLDERGVRRGVNQVLAILIHEALQRPAPTALRFIMGKTKRYTAELDNRGRAEFAQLLIKYERECDLHLVRSGKAKKPKKSAVLRQLIHDEATRCKAAKEHGWEQQEQCC